jgi:hypothetical protein
MYGLLRHVSKSFDNPLYHHPEMHAVLCALSKGGWRLNLVSCRCVVQVTCCMASSLQMEYCVQGMPREGGVLTHRLAFCRCVLVCLGNTVYYDATLSVGPCELGAVGGGGGG